MASGIALALADSATILGPPPPSLLCQSLLNLGFFPRTSFWPWLKMSFCPSAATQLHGGEVASSRYLCHCPQVHSPLLPCVPPRLYCSTDCQTRCPLPAQSGPACCPHPFPLTEPACPVWLPCPSFTLTQGLAYIPSDTICSHGSKCTQVCVFCLLSMVQQHFKLCVFYTPHKQLKLFPTPYHCDTTPCATETWTTSLPPAPNPSLGLKPRALTCQTGTEQQSRHSVYFIFRRFH